LYPEVIITNDINIFKTIPNRLFIVKESVLDIDGFKNALKLCAPLAINNWVIFIEVKNNNLTFGLVSAEMTETSLSLYTQLIDSQVELGDMKLAYIKCLASKIVELVGIKSRVIVALTLDDEKKVLNDEISKLSQEVSKQCEGEYKDKTKAFFEKILNEAIKTGHGNLIGIINDDDDTIQQLKEKLNDGIYLDSSIDIAALVRTAEQEKTNETSVTLKAYTSILISMLNHDGITIITDKGRILGYHLFVKSDDNADVVGGARARAFESMKKLDLKVCFYRSQDGNIKYYSHE
jgi:hypothetical protein